MGSPSRSIPGTNAKHNNLNVDLKNLRTQNEFFPSCRRPAAGAEPPRRLAGNAAGGRARPASRAPTSGIGLKSNVYSNLAYSKYIQSKQCFPDNPSRPAIGPPHALQSF
jgi:hypothetical protein